MLQPKEILSIIHRTIQKCLGCSHIKSKAKNLGHFSIIRLETCMNQQFEILSTLGVILKIGSQNPFLFVF